MPTKALLPASIIVALSSITCCADDRGTPQAANPSEHLRRTLLYAKGFANGCLKTACIFGLITGGASQSLSLIFYAVMPIPGVIITKWVFFGLIQGVTLGVVAWAVYKRKPDPVDASSR